MMLKEILNSFEIVDDPDANGEKVAEHWKEINPEADVEVKTVRGKGGATDFVKLIAEGTEGKLSGGDNPTLGIIGRLGGVGARPGEIGAVSDADGAIVAIACGSKLIDMSAKGDRLKGDVIISTHVCPNAPIQPHDPVPFMGSPVDMKTMNKYEVDDRMDAILSVDATKGNRVINQNGFALSPTVKEGYILKLSDDLLRLMQLVTGKPPVTFPITTQDITPYGNGLHHINSILQPSTATDSPVVGVATTSGSVIPGVTTGVNYPIELEKTARFCLEVAKEFTERTCKFYDHKEFKRILDLYGSMKKLQKSKAIR